MEEPKVFVCEQMQKLRDILTEKGVEWHDGSSEESQICQTLIVIEKKKWSAINGYGTEGGKKRIDSPNFGCLELWDYTKKNGPVGWLSAENVLEKIGIEL